MNELQRKAELYAAEKMNELMTKAITQAYIDGYKYRESEIMKVDCIEEKIDIQDLGLPSGTLWSLNYLKDEEEDIKYLPYVKAVKLGLPTKEQIEELIENCRWQGEFSSSGLTFYGAICIGANGERIAFNSSGYMEDEEKVGTPYYGGGNAYFWIQDEEEENEKNAVRIYDVENGKPKMEIVKIFSGYKLPVLIVRK
jgi:hypothetical protein